MRSTGAVGMMLPAGSWPNDESGTVVETGSEEVPANKMDTRQHESAFVRAFSGAGRHTVAHDLHPRLHLTPRLVSAVRISDPDLDFAPARVGAMVEPHRFEAHDAERVSVVRHLSAATA